jgi:hypothetical protein
MSNLSVASHNLAAKLLDLIKAMPTDKYDALNAKYKDYVAAVEVAKAAMVKAKEDNDNDNGVACERSVDDIEEPNVYPYKKCSVCSERSSCGNYNDNKEWVCESCAADAEA